MDLQTARWIVSYNTSIYIFFQLENKKSLILTITQVATFFIHIVKKYPSKNLIVRATS